VQVHEVAVAQLLRKVQANRLDYLAMHSTRDWQFKHIIEEVLELGKQDAKVARHLPYKSLVSKGLKTKSK
jgi:hypothetical protein